MKLVSLSLFFLIASLVSGQENPAGKDWPRWRGPDRLGIWHGGPELKSLRPEMIEQLWSVEIGPGYNGPTVSEGRVYAMDYVRGREQVLCFSAKDGQKLWSHSYPVTYSVGYPTGPRASVLIEDGKAYSFGTMGHLCCFDAGNGEVLWEVNTLEDFRVRLPIWGLASNPIITGEKLIVQLGGEAGAGIVAFHKETGQEIWRALEDEASYSAPVLLTQAGKEVLVCWTGESISGLDPKKGLVYWSLPFQPGNMIMNIADPVYDPPYLFLSGFFDGSYLLKLDQEALTASMVYHRHGENEKKTDALHCCISTPFINEGFVYGIGSYGEARCLDLLTGERLWEDLSLVPKARWANVHLVRQGDLTWGFNELGELLLGRFTPEGYVDLGRAKVIDPLPISPNPRNGVCWAHPAFSGEKIFIRSDEQLICIQVNNP
jgi:outer membrane protein assembly factor BamB